jgi:hypothetical protein
MKLEKIKTLATTLAECVFACNDCHEKCLREKHVAMMVDCIRLDKDCAAVCGATLQLLYDGSPLMGEALGLCITACEMCAEECARHEEAHCQECARICRECAATCREFKAAHAHSR